MTLYHLINVSLLGRLFPFWFRIARWIPSDRLYLKIFYRLAMGEALNLKNPKTFTQKIQWLKLHNTNPLYSKMVDKFQVRNIITEMLGSEYLIPLLGVWSRFEEIDFSQLPPQFVLKTTHDSGNVIVCKDKETFDFSKARKKLTKALKTNYFFKSREYPYKHAVPRIIAEKYMFDETQEELTDYKFFCFNGKPELLQITANKGFEKSANYYDIEFDPLDLSTGSYPLNMELSKPENYSEMLKIAELLSQDIIHVRIDLYSIKSRIYFGEFTFHNSGGIVNFSPPIWNQRLGDMIELPI
jgi:hypothetical protein